MNITNKLQTVATNLSGTPVNFVAGDLVIPNDGMCNVQHLRHGHIYCVATPSHAIDLPMNHPRAPRSFGYDPRAIDVNIPMVTLVDLEGRHYSWVAESEGTAVVFETHAYRVRLATPVEIMRYNDYVERLAECLKKQNEIVKTFQEQVKPFQEPMRPATTL